MVDGNTELSHLSLPCGCVTVIPLATLFQYDDYWHASTTRRSCSLGTHSCMHSICFTLLDVHSAPHFANKNCILVHSCQRMQSVRVPFELSLPFATLLLSFKSIHFSPLVLERFAGFSVSVLAHWFVRADITSHHAVCTGALIYICRRATLHQHRFKRPFTPNLLYKTIIASILGR